MNDEKYMISLLFSFDLVVSKICLMIGHLESIGFLNFAYGMCHGYSARIDCYNKSNKILYSILWRLISFRSKII